MKAICIAFALSLAAVACAGDAVSPTTLPAASTRAAPMNPSFAQGDKVAVCHVTGNGGSIGLIVDASAVPAHLAHGDRMGTDCSPSSSCDVTVSVAFAALAILTNGDIRVSISWGTGGSAPAVHYSVQAFRPQGGGGSWVEYVAFDANALIRTNTEFTVGPEYFVDGGVTYRIVASCGGRDELIFGPYTAVRGV